MFLKQTLYVSVWGCLGKHVPCSIVNILEQNTFAYMTCIPYMYLHTWTCNSRRLCCFHCLICIACYNHCLLINNISLLFTFVWCFQSYFIHLYIILYLESHFVFKKIKTVFIPPYGYYFVIISGVLTLRNEVGSRRAWRDFFFIYLHSTFNKLNVLPV